MTIVASVKVRDGLILGTDSMTQITQNTPEGPRVLKTYSNARKLFQIRERPIGVMTYGLGNVGQRSIEGVVLDYCATDNSAAAETVLDVSQGLYEFVKPLYDAMFEGVPAEQLPSLGFFLAGYSANEAQFPEECEFLLPRDAAPFLLRPATEFGCSWRGIDTPFVRLYKGYDPRVAERLLARGLTDGDVQALLGDLEAPVIYDGMPVQDAASFCAYILESTIGYTTYHVGVPACGYPLQVAMILADKNFSWVSKPELTILR